MELLHGRNEQSLKPFNSILTKILNTRMVSVSFFLDFPLLLQYVCIRVSYVINHNISTTDNLLLSV